jgi:hypothetical protein
LEKDREKQDVHADQETEMELVRHTLRKGHKAIEREVLDWNPQGKGGEGNVDIRGEELSTRRH